MSQLLNDIYPHLSFRKQWNLSDKYWLLLGQCEAYVKAIHNTPILPHHYHELMNVALLKGAQATTAIEGNTLSDEEIRLLMQGQKLPPSREYQEIEVRNILTALNDLLNEVAEEKTDSLITIDLIRRFHKMAGRDLGEYFAAIPGSLRGNEVVVGNYRCPDHLDVPVLLDHFCEWMRNEFQYEYKRQSFSDVLIQAIVSHVYVEWIHPFSDGNGRTGRLLEFYILLRGGNPDIASHILSNHYNNTRTEYYRQIDKARENRDLTCFLEYAILGFRDGLELTLKVIQKSQFENTWQKLLYDKFDAARNEMTAEVFSRQRTLALEFPLERSLAMPDISLLSPLIARTYATVSEKTLQRDVERLIDMKILVRTGDTYAANTGIMRLSHYYHFS